MRQIGLVFTATLALAGLDATAASAIPLSVTLVGDLQNEIGCTGDYTASCLASGLAFDSTDDVWQASFELPAGNYSYFVALDGTFDVTYGQGGGNALTPVMLSLSDSRTVKFYYDDKSHWVTDNVTSPIVVLTGSFQTELGCAGDFDSSCLRSWLQDLDGDGIFTGRAELPAGNYSTVVTIGESFDEVYGAGGVPGGSNIDFTASLRPVRFSFDRATNILTIDTGAVPEPDTWILLIGGMGLVGSRLRRSRRTARAA